MVFQQSIWPNGIASSDLLPFHRRAALKGIAIRIITGRFLHLQMQPVAGTASRKEPRVLSMVVENDAATAFKLLQVVAGYVSN